MRAHTLVALSAVWIGGSLVACNLPEEKPAKSAAAVPQCPPEPEVQGMVVSTIHEYHLAVSGYPLAKIGDVMDAFRPDLVLLDLPPDELKGEHTEEAPIEVEYVKYVAGTRSADVEAIGPEGYEPPIGAKAEKEDEERLRRETSVLDGLDSLSFEEANGREITNRIREALNTKARYAKGNPDWARHEGWLEHGAMKAIASKKPKRVLAVVDPSNRPAMEGLFYSLGLAVKDPIRAAAEAKEKRDEGPVPSLVVKAWSQQLDRVRDRVRRLKPGVPERVWLEQHLAVLQIAIDKNGACCVKPDMLVPPEPKDGGGKKDDKKK
jgi:hypothetical protein